MTDHDISPEDRAAIDAYVTELLKTAPVPTDEQIQVLRRWFGPNANRGRGTSEAGR